MDMAQLTVVLPAYNEDGAIGRTLDELVAAVKGCDIEFEVVVVNDGSTDQTADVLGVCSSRDPRIRVVTHEVNRGYGAAVRSGFRHSRGEWVLLMDSDGQFDPHDLALVWGQRDVDCAVLGYRVNRADPINRLRNARLWNYGVRVLLGVHVRDLDCAFKLFPGDHLRSLPIRSDGAGISAELLWRWKRAGWRWVEVPVHHRPRVSGLQTGAGLSVVLRGISEVLRFALVGAANSLTVWGLLTGWASLTGVVGGPTLVFGNIIAWSGGLLMSYKLNQHFTFRRRGSPMRFILTNVSSFVINTIVLLSVTPLTSRLVGRGPGAVLAATIIATMLSATWTYLLYSRWVFPIRQLMPIGADERGHDGAENR